MTAHVTRCARCEQHGPHLPVLDALNGIHRGLHDLARPIERHLIRLLDAIARALEGKPS